MPHPLTSTQHPLSLILSTQGGVQEENFTLPFCPISSMNAHHNHGNKTGDLEGFTIDQLKYLTYGLIWPSICALGIVGNVLNLLVLSQPNMKGTAYIYMRGYSSAALMAIIVAIPFAVRILFHNESGPWGNFYQAFFHTYLELYLGNSCLGIGVMMLLALTMERFVAVCHPEKSRALQGSQKAYIIIVSIPLLTLLAHSPHLLRFRMVECLSINNGGVGRILYTGKENGPFLTSTFFLFYKWLISLTFRLIPTLLLAYLNLRIVVAYRRTCKKRRVMTGKLHNPSEVSSKKFAEESRIMLLLGSTSVLFFLCVTPMVFLSLMFTRSLLGSFSFQVFRSVANLLELTNYSLTFYIYCLFSREFRNTFFGLFRKTEKERRKGKMSVVKSRSRPVPSPVIRAADCEKQSQLRTSSGQDEGKSPLLL